MLRDLGIMMPNQDESLNFYAAGLTFLIGTGTVVAILVAVIVMRFL